MKIAIYRSDDVGNDYYICGRFLDENGIPTPVTFYGVSETEVRSRMTKWLADEREKLARLDAHRAYLRSPEAIEKRRVALQAARELRKAAR